MTQKIISLAFVGTMLLACTSGKRALEQGNYDEAVQSAVGRLQKSPTNSKALAVLAEAYPLALRYHNNRIANWEKSVEPFHWEKVVDEFQAMNQLGEAIDQCPACIRAVGDGKKYVQPLQSALNLAATDRYASGSQWLQTAEKNRQDAKNAYFDFQKALSLVPHYKDAEQKRNQAYDWAVLPVVVEQVAVTSKLYQLSNQYFQDKIQEYLQTNARLNQFVQFYAPEQATQLKIRPKHIVRLQFDDFVVGQTMISTNTETLTSKDSVKVGEATVNGKKVPVYNKVTAKLSLSRKTVTSNGVLDMLIIDFASNQVIHREKIPGQYVWMSEWGNFNGDERALTKEQLALTRNRELLPPAPQQLFIEFTKPIFNQFTSKIRRYYEPY